MVYCKFSKRGVCQQSPGLQDLKLVILMGIAPKTAERATQSAIYEYPTPCNRCPSDTQYVDVAQDIHRIFKTFESVGFIKGHIQFPNLE